MNIVEAIKNSIIILDGAMGTMLQQRGLSPGDLPELLNISHPHIVTEIHREYVEAGADVITANTFQAHELKLGGHSVETVVSAGIKCAKDAGAKFVALDVGPIGQLLEPIGTITFETAYNVFKRQMIAGEQAGADLIIIETISDLYEAKAAILAAKENTDLPVFCTMTFQDDGRTFLGCDPLSAVLTLQGLGVDAVGVNCSQGPDKLGSVVETMLQYARIPVVLQANAGLPVSRGGEDYYEMQADEYADLSFEMVKKGVRVVGGCCGTTPEYIRKIKEKISSMLPVITTPKIITACTSGTATVILDGNTTEIGERLNPTGKKKLQAALRNGDMAYIAREAISQIEAGAHVLDVNVGLPELDEPAVMAAVIRKLQGIVTVPLQIDSSNPAAIEAGLRVYNGRPIINSVNGKAESMAAIFPLAKKYGALVIGLTLDENGIPQTAHGRMEIARNLRDTARKYGLCDHDLLIDCLVLTASAQQEQVKETLKAIRLVKSELGLKTVLGVSNVSFGMPERDLMNAVFLAAALGAGLDAAILNPVAVKYREVLDTYRVLSGEDKNGEYFIARYSREKETAPKSDIAVAALSDIIIQGRADESAAAVKKLLKTTEPMNIIDNEFIPALNIVGKRFAAGEIFLPQLMQSAQAVQNGFAVIKDHMQLSGKRHESKGKIVMATVHGDIHDIGKNIVCMVLESYGYEVIDLGKDVPAAVVVDAIAKNNVQLVGLSALMTTTVKSMKETIAAIRDAGLNCRIMVGGAVMNKEYADFVGADDYVKDAMDNVRIAGEVFSRGLATVRF